MRTGTVVLVVADHQADVVEEQVLLAQRGAHGEAAHVVDFLGAEVALDARRHGQVVHDPGWLASCGRVDGSWSELV